MNYTNDARTHKHQNYRDIPTLKHSNIQNSFTIWQCVCI